MTVKVLPMARFRRFWFPGPGWLFVVIGGAIAIGFFQVAVAEAAGLPDVPK